MQRYTKEIPTGVIVSCTLAACQYPAVHTFKNCGYILSEKD